MTYIIQCPYYRSHRCTLLPPEESSCLTCKNNGMCALECDCEEETCNIGSKIELN